MEFIPLAEETGLILPIGEWVLQHAIIQASAWRQAGLPPLSIAVNVSARQFRQASFAGKVGQVLQDSGFDPHQLELELTETSLMSHVDKNIATLNELSAMGIRIAVDDFGTGYSSLSYLRRLPVDILKVDKSFVNAMTENPDDAAIVEAIIAMARSLHLTVVAEGVETIEQFKFLQLNHCDEIQGYYFSRPLPAEQFEKFFRETDAQGNKLWVSV